MSAFHHFKELPSQEILPGLRARFLHTDKQTTAYWEIEKDCVMPLHNHIHEQQCIVLEGELELTVDGKSQVLKRGQIALIPSNVPHMAKAITFCLVVDIFHPVREDYIL